MGPNKITMIRLLLATIVLVSPCRGRRLPVGAILPGIGTFFGKKDETDPPSRPGQPTSGDRRGPPLDQHGRLYPSDVPRRPPLLSEIPPPPPPPPGSSVDANKEAGESSGHDATTPSAEEMSDDDDHHESAENQGRNQGWGLQSHSAQGPYGTIPPPPPPGRSGYSGESWLPPPYPPAGWTIPDQRQYQDERRGADRELDSGYLQQQMNDLITRENDFLLQIQNLTASLVSMEQREELHVRQLDVLTERVMEREAELAAERNAAMEYNANCTELGRSLAVMQDELEEWKARCLDLTERHQRDEERLEEMKGIVQERNDEVEQLATSIENSRLSRQRDHYTTERSKKRRRGFFAWLFGFSKEDTDDEEEHLQELAKSTLLRALQTERNNVHELEAALSMLQQNNSAVSEMVESRDMVINELNDRVAVFEEDKVVLKAALKQLQKEIKDEAPKTQRLVKDLKHAKQEIERLNFEIQSLIATHQEEISVLQQTIAQKQSAINATESNLTVIGTYVDKLEERLASFAIARREIDLREQRCKDIEARAEEAERERDDMKVKVDLFTKEHEELKSLFEEMVKERAALQQDKSSLHIERDQLLEGEKRLQVTIDSLEREVAHLGDALGDWKSKVRNLELDLEEEREKYREAQGKLDEFVDARQYDEVSDDTDYADALSELATENQKSESRAEQHTITAVEAKGEEVTDRSNDMAGPSKLPGPSVVAASPGPTNATSSIVHQAPFLKEALASSPQSSRNVPFRGFRKALSRHTGIHGLITPPSPKRKLPSSVHQGANDGRVPSPMRTAPQATRER